MRLLVLIVGAGGQLGQVMAERLAPRHEVVALARDALDVTSAEAIRTTVTDICPDVIVNCSAYTNVDGAETDPLQAFSVNSWAPRLLARAASAIDATLVHYSTDFVFDGTTDRPYGEDDVPNPRGTYAMSKLLGEWFAEETPRHYVLRVESLFGGSRAKSSIDWMLNGLRSGTAVRAFVDRSVSPSYVVDVAEATAWLVERSAPFGLYHCVNSGWTTWAELARELARLTGRPDAPIEEVRMANAGLVARRPQFAALSNERLLSAGVTMPTWQEALARYVAATG